MKISIKVMIELKQINEGVGKKKINEGLVQLV